MSDVVKMETENVMDKVESAITELSHRSQAFPKEAFRVITENKEEAIPYLRNSLEKAIHS